MKPLAIVILDTEQRRKVLRKQAHEQILEAFQGVASTDTSLGMFKLMREQRDAFSSAEELRDELKQLREYEETTDDLVDRLRIKVLFSTCSVVMISQTVRT